MADTSAIAAITAAGMSEAILRVATFAQRGIIAQAPRVAKRSISLQTAVKNGITSAEIRAGGLSSVIVYGAKPHSIQPVHKKALFWAGAAHPMRGVILHPGTAPNDFWGRGLALIPREATAALFAAGGRIVLGYQRVIDRGPRA